MSVSATLRDLAPAEKQKVARLIRQVVEKERALKEVEAVAAKQEANEAARAAQLTQQNMDMARENASLRAKLSHAFDVLRSYQHKYRVLDTTVQLTNSRPVSPGFQPTHAATCAALTGWTGPGVDAKQLAHRLSQLGSSHDSSNVSDSIQGVVGQHIHGCLSSGQPNPMAEGPCEAASSHQLPGAIFGEALGQQQQHNTVPTLLEQQPQNAHTTLQHPAPVSAHTSAGFAGNEFRLRMAAVSHPEGIQLTQQALPQLENLKLPAQALSDSQAKAAARQHQQQQREQRGQQWEQSAKTTLPNAPHLPIASLLAAMRHDCGSAVLVFDPNLGPHGGYLISPPQFLDEDAGTSCVKEGGSTGCHDLQPGSSEAPKRAPLADLQQQVAVSQSVSECGSAPASHPSHGGSSRGSSFGSRELMTDGSLMDLVRDVESMMMQPEQHYCSTYNLTNPPSASGAGFISYGLLPAKQHESTYEENDLLDLISQL